MADGRRYVPAADTPELSAKLSNGGLPEPPGWLRNIIQPQRQQTQPVVERHHIRFDGNEQRFIKSALTYIDADDREIWLKVGGALHDSGHPWARTVWDHWSRKSAKFDPADQEKTWRSFARSTGARAGIGTIVHLARERGFSERKGNGTLYVVNEPGSAPEWPEPKPIPDGLLPVRTFEFGYLPESIAPWVADIADRMQCPPDFVGIPALVALGSALGRKVGIRPQSKTDWTEVPNLWGCIVGRPGAMKSPAMQEALKPLHRIEALARKEADEARKDYEEAAALYAIEKDVAKEKARRALKSGERAEGLFPIGEPLEPKAKRFITNDTTYEKLGEILADNRDGVLTYRDELVSLLKTLDREEHAAARGFYLTAWNGTSSYTFDRIIRGKTHIDAACVSLLGSTQPGRLAEYIGRAITGGSGDDGLIQRFSLLVWPDQSPEWREQDRYPLTDARQAAWETFDGFVSFDPMAFGAQRDSDDGLPYLRFDEAARNIFRDWHADLEKLLRRGELSPALESHLSKYRKAVPALALINHVADAGGGPVGEAAILRALALAEYLKPRPSCICGRWSDRANGRQGDLVTNSQQGFAGRVHDQTSGGGAEVKSY